MFARLPFAISSVVAFLGAWLLATAPFLFAPSPALADAAADIPADWLSAVEQDIAAQEYQVTWQEHTPLGDLPRAYQAPNRAHNFRTYFTPAGFRSIPRDTPQDEAPAWEWGLEWCAMGRASAMQPVAEAVLGTNGNRVEYRRGELLEWYVNDARGLEQGFTIQKAPGGSRGDGGTADATSPLRLAFQVGGNVQAVLAEAGNAVEFLAPGGALAIRFAELRVADATGADLRAWFEVEGGSVSMVVDDCGAVYPLTIDPLATSPSWTAESDQAYAYFGFSVAPAGDVNGDGYSDVIVGAANYDNGQSNEGRAYVYHGSAAGLSAAANWTAESDQENAFFGNSVATAGDVNGDGYSDVIVGARTYNNGQFGEGRAYVYHGSAAGLSAAASWTAESDRASAYFGFSVATAGDVNGDGYSDVIVGARQYDNGQAAEGRAYVYHGSAAGLSATANWTAESDQASAGFGNSVATAGDVNGDGYSDVIVGANAYDNGQSNEGRAYVYNGAPAGLSAAASWTAESDQASAEFGYSVATAGDVNGDGYSEVIVAACSGQTQEGWAYVYHGSAAGLSAAASWTAESNQAGAQFGYSVATAGDVNGDGYSDVIVGADYYDNGQSNEGRAFVYHGSAAGLSATANWTAESDQAGAQFGYSVATAGDVNGDGYSDVIVGAVAYSHGQSNEGRAYVYHGSAAGLSTVAGWTAESDQAVAQLGFSVATAGDVNGDGYSDVIVGAYFYSNGQNAEGRAYVYHGTASGLSAAASWTAESNQQDAFFGYSVATAGDVNGDGYSDVIVGATHHDNGQSDEGRAYVYHGSAAGLSTVASWTAESDQDGAQFGVSVATAGDVNGDGYSDVIVGAHRYDNGQSDEGRAYVYHGSAAGLSTAASWTAESDQAAADLHSVATAGDVNGDGYSDVIVGAYLYDNGEVDEGRAYVHHGSPSGLSAAASWTTESNQASAAFGYSVATAGDLDGDGYSDVIVGAYGYDNGQSNEGRAYVYHGSAAGLSTAASWRAESDQASASFGVSVATAGDVNGDGYSDVIVGADRYDNGQINEGRAFVYHGSAVGLSAAAIWTAESDQADAYFGYSVATAGDVNGDGYSDVIVGSWGYDNGQNGEGRAFGFYGNAGGGRVSLPRQLRTDGATPIALRGRSDSQTQFRIGATMLSVYGRTRLAMRHEVKPLGALFDGTNTVTEGFLDTGSDGQIEVNRLVSGLSPSTLYHWRVRAEYNLARTPFQRHGPWVHVPLLGWNESRLRTAAGITSVEETPEVAPRFELSAAGPNPARDLHSVRLVLPRPGRVRAEVIDVTGRQVADLTPDALYPAGSHVLTWNGRTAGGERVAAGVYFVQVRVDGEARVRRLVIVR